MKMLLLLTAIMSLGLFTLMLNFMLLANGSDHPWPQAFKTSRIKENTWYVWAFQPMDHTCTIFG